MQYRREVDGLRAVAVLPVILFHAGMPFVNGGFVGVDVFFVISGYLITTILAQENAAGRFSLGRFYERRARRILPALFTVLLACLPFAWMWLLPADMQSFARSLIGVCLFASNIVFWRTSGYFDTDSELTPLLHTWSLAVEEQYYVFFPLCLMLAWKLGRRWLMALLGVAAALSLLAAQWGAVHRAAATFYLLPTRGWELLIGAMVALYLSRSGSHGGHRGPRAHEAGALTGLLLITCSIFVFDKHLPFPSFYALVPTVGTALIILFATPATLVGRLLGSKPFVGIGLISYSAYLWHQPLFAFARYYKSTQQAPGRALMLGLAVLTLGLAWLSWRFIETPTRDRQRFSRGKVWTLTVAGTAGFIALGTWALAQQGFDSRLGAEQRAVAAYSHYDVAPYGAAGCFLEPEFSHTAFAPDCWQAQARPSKDGLRHLIWGDSYAAALAIGLRETLGPLMQYTASACPPYLDVDVPHRPHCRALNSFVIERIAALRPDELILHGEWHIYRAPLDSALLARTLARVREVSPGTRITVIGSVPQWPPSLPVYAVRKGATLGQSLYLPMPAHALLDTVDTALASIATAHGARFVSALDLMCRDGHLACLAVVSAPVSAPVPRAPGFALSAWDNGHLTQAGAVWLASRLNARP